MNRRMRDRQRSLLGVLAIAAVLATLPGGASLGEGGLLRARRWLRRPQPGVQVQKPLPADVDPADLEPPEVTGVPPVADVMRELAAAQRGQKRWHREGPPSGNNGTNSQYPAVVRPAQEHTWHEESDPVTARASSDDSPPLPERATTAYRRPPAPSAERQQVVTVELAPLGFHGVQPGKSRVDDVLKLLGQPAGTEANKALRVDVYAQEPFREIRLAYAQGIVRSIAIVLDGPLSRDQIVEHLGLHGVEAAPLYDERGNLTGYAYPERGLVLHVAEHASGSHGHGAAAARDADDNGHADRAAGGHDRTGREPPHLGTPEQTAEVDRLAADNSAGTADRATEPADNGPGKSVDGSGQAEDGQLAIARLPALQDQAELIGVVVLEEIDPLAFVRRAEVRLPLKAEAALVDLETALALDPSCHVALEAKASLLTLLGRYAEALEVAEAAIAADGTRPEYRLARAAALLKAGRNTEALAAVQELLGEDGGASQLEPHLAARAALIAGQCAALAPRPDYARASQWHLRALKLAEKALGSEEIQARRLAAACLVEGHLAMAYNVAWGRWKDKPATVERWLSRASQLVDEAATSKLLDPTWELRLGQGALAALVGLQERAVSASWVAQTQTAAARLLQATHDPATVEMVQWELGTALYDAVQIAQLRGELDLALALGRDAAAALAAGVTGREPNAGDDYLLGRLYYRLGAIYALTEENHIRATEWYDEALPWLGRPASEIPKQLLLPWGEMLVSMAVSYWEAGTHSQAIELTLQGTGMMEQAVQQHQADQEVLAVPYGNLARMFEHAGDAAQAARYRQLAGKLPTAVTPR